MEQPCQAQNWKKMFIIVSLKIATCLLTVMLFNKNSQFNVYNVQPVDDTWNSKSNVYHS